MTWKLIVIATCLLVVLAFAFLFKLDSSVSILGIPYILWSGVLLTVLLVVLTWLGGKSFPHKEN